MTVIIGFYLAGMVGFLFGFGVCAALVAAKRSDQQLQAPVRVNPVWKQHA